MTVSDKIGGTIYFALALLWNNVHIQFVFIMAGTWCNPHYSGNKKWKLYKKTWTLYQRMLLLPLLGKKSSTIFKICFCLYYLILLLAFTGLYLVKIGEESGIIIVPAIAEIVLCAILLEIPHHDEWL